MGSRISDRKFVFSGSHEALTPSLQQMLDYINDYIPLAAKTDDVFFRHKIIITELLTNAIKHAAGGNTTVDIRINDQSLVIIKTDEGEAFNLLNGESEIPANLSGYKKTVSADPIHCLSAVWENNNKIHFECEDNDMADPWDINDMMEHFGLLIITKSADEFIYTYDEQRRLNIFTVTVEY